MVSVGFMLLQTIMYLAGVFVVCYRQTGFAILIHRIDFCVLVLMAGIFDWVI